jgi:hypothetical protein
VFAKTFKSLLQQNRHIADNRGTAIICPLLDKSGLSEKRGSKSKTQRQSLVNQKKDRRDEGRSDGHRNQDFLPIICSQSRPGDWGLRVSLIQVWHHIAAGLAANRRPARPSNQIGQI